MPGQPEVDAFAIKKIMGHSTVKVRERYIHPSEKAVRLAFEKVQNQQQPVTISATVSERLAVSHRGGMGEWLKPAVLKTVSPERGSRVRIPLPPPLF